MAGFGKDITLTVHIDNSITVSDNGRGIPTGMHATEGKPAAEVVLTTLHAGGKFENDAYKVSGGLHGVGISVVNALAERLEVEIWRDGNTHEQAYERGKPVTEFRQAGTTDRRGTRVMFKPDPQIFEELVYNFDVLAQRFRELAFLNKGITIRFVDERADPPAQIDPAARPRTPSVGPLLSGRLVLDQSYLGNGNYTRLQRLLPWRLGIVATGLQLRRS